MRDLRRRALESNKTVSRKAAAKVPSTASSTTNSPAVSRNASRAASRNVSDDEGELSDTTNFSTNSIDDILASEVDAPPDAWKHDLSERINHIIDRKRSSVQGREESLNVLSYILMAHFAQQEIKGTVGELVPALLKSIKAGQTEKETILALKAMSLILITEPSDSIYDAVVQPMKIIITDSHEHNAKVAALHALGIATFYGGASMDETQEIMDFLLEIVESDGETVEAGDDGEIVTAALEVWGFLATQLDDMEDTSEEPMEAFVEQLESSEVNVQIAAGENIALLYEKSYTEREDDDEPEVHDGGDEDADPADASMVKRYTVYRREDQLIHTLEELSKASSRRMSKKDRKSLHSNFADIANSVEHPTRGPRYSNAIDAETGRPYGSRMTIGVGGKSQMIIDTWWKLHRLKALRRVLQGGFLVHYADNEVVFDTLPVMLRGE